MSRALRRIGVGVLLGVTTLLLFCSASMSATLVWRYEGTFTTVPLDYQADGLKVGDDLFGFLLVDTTANDAFPDDSVRGQYNLVNSSVCVPVLTSCWTFAGPSTTHLMTVLNDDPQDPPFDFFEAFMRDVALDSAADPSRLFFFNGPAATTLFPSDALPLTPPPVAAFQFLSFAYTDFSKPNSASGMITEIRRVPEPGTILLLGLAIVCMRRRAACRRTPFDPAY
jgi:hypothetical protein